MYGYTGKTQFKEFTGTEFSSSVITQYLVSGRDAKA